MPPRQRCQPCHISQKRCDRQRPCERCAARGFDCRYIPNDTWAFVDQNAFSAELSRRKASRAQTSSVSRNSGLKKLIESNIVLTCKLTRPPLWTLDHRICSRLHGRWTTGLTCLGSQDPIWRVHESADETSPVRSAVLAVAYADLAVVEKHGDAASRSLHAYHETLRLIRAALERRDDSSLTAGDEMLCAILAIDSYEVGSDDVPSAGVRKS